MSRATRQAQVEAKQTTKDWDPRNFPYRTLTLFAACALCGFIGYAIGQGQANQEFVILRTEAIVDFLCRRSTSQACRDVRGTLPEQPPMPQAAAP